MDCKMLDRKKRQSFNIKFKVLSGVILSPRQEKALYKGIDFEDNNISGCRLDNAGRVTQIYPFYRYQERDDFKTYPDYLSQSEPYIPGSSLKGALSVANGKGLSKTEDKQIIFCDDILLKDKRSIVLEQIHKFRYIEEAEENSTQNNLAKSIKYGVFFDNLAVEMLKEGTTFESGEALVFQQNQSPDTFLKEAAKHTYQQLKGYKNYVEAILSDSKERQMEDGTGREKLEELMDKTRKLLKDYDDSNEDEKAKGLLFLGGFKGGLSMLSFPADEQDSQKNKQFKHALYVDPQTSLPYGLVEISWEKRGSN